MSSLRMRRVMDLILSEGVIDPIHRKFHNEKMTVKQKTRLTALVESELEAATREMVSRRKAMEALSEGPDRVKAEEDYLVAKTEHEKVKKKKKSVDDARVLKDRDVKEARDEVSFMRRMMKDRRTPNARKVTITEASERLKKELPKPTIKQPIKFDLTLRDLMESDGWEEGTSGPGEGEFGVEEDAPAGQNYAGVMSKFGYEQEPGGGQWNRDNHRVMMTPKDGWVYQKYGPRLRELGMPGWKTGKAAATPDQLHQHLAQVHGIREEETGIEEDEPMVNQAAAKPAGGGAEPMSSAGSASGAGAGLGSGSQAPVSPPEAHGDMSVYDVGA